MNPTTSRKLELIAESEASRELLMEQAIALKHEFGTFTAHTRKVALLSTVAIGVIITLWVVRRYRAD